MLIVENGTVRKETYEEWRARMDARFEEQVAARMRDFEAEESQRRMRSERPKRRPAKTRTATHGQAIGTRTRIIPGQKCAGCDWKLVPRTGAPVPEGHREHAGRGMCNTCLRRARTGGKKRFKRPPNCVRCGIAIVGRDGPRPEGARRHAGLGLCTACHKAANP